MRGNSKRPSPPFSDPSQMTSGSLTAAAVLHDPMFRSGADACLMILEFHCRKGKGLLQGVDSEKSKRD